MSSREKPRDPGHGTPDPSHGTPDPSQGLRDPETPEGDDLPARPAPSETRTGPAGGLVEPAREHLVDHFVDPVMGHVVGPVREHVVEPVWEHVVDPVVGHVVGRIVTPVAGAVGPVASAVGHALGAAGGAIAGRDAVIARRLKRQAREPLANLYELHPEARDASPRELGVRFVPLEEIVGTAVAGGAQRGGDFLPLPPFRSDNWMSRWQRIQRANERLVSLPPVNLVKFADGYWVEDGHNRVASALYAGGAGVDAVVTELVPLGARSSETPGGLLGLLVDAGELRTQVFEATTAHREDEAPHEASAAPDREADSVTESR